MLNAIPKVGCTIIILYLYVWDEFMYFEIRLGSYSMVTILPYVFFREGFAMGMFVRLMQYASMG